ncbi:protein kinase domain-containing protein [Tautonia rosea]|uniref:protein kinase domain-containing protein n=1 Tax=Tautonia rosea TaxID=2728037 RepID=UPI001F1E61E1|nr:tetratricopeptide repeat protein [Tautonia rosea]
MSERTIFMEALDFEDPDAQRAFLDQACQRNVALRARVESLLQSHRKAGDFLDDDPAHLLSTEAGGPLAEPSIEAIGTVIGPYTLLEPIGEGGMGTVYMADQERPVRRRVALKVIKPGMDTKQVIARFEAERQALALMDHPNIARVLDAGTNDSGRPYFVMELVKGLPITEFCDRHRLDIQERLDLFVRVCQAVQHAHQKGIIHRDLKPSNILVTLHDGEPVPKVIDFGIAKATSQSLTDKTLFTGFAQLVGTPQYMSPEQAEFSGLDIDTRSDIYSLGVLLYELLTGSTPIQREEFQRAPLDQIRRLIHDREAVTPSTRLSGLGKSLSTISASRGADPRRILVAVRGDLDWIVMKCLEKKRDRRYETANALAAELRRHLNNEPVLARPPSAAYQFQKFASRNRAILTSTVLIVLVLVTATVLSLLQAHRATRAEAQAAASAEETSLVVEYLVNDVFGAAAPERLQGKTPTLQDIFVAGEAAIPARFGHHPTAEASARIALGRAYYDLGRYEDAAPQFRLAAALRAEHLGPDHPQTLTAEAMVVRALCPDALGLVAIPDEAEPIARRVMETRRRVLGPNDRQTLDSMTTLGHVLQVKFNKALLERFRKAPNLSLSDEVLRTLGTVPMGEAQTLLEDAYQGQTRLLGPDHPETLETLHVLGRVLYCKADHVNSERVLRQAVAGRDRVLGADHPATLASRKFLATTLQRRQQNEEAILLYAQVAEAHRRLFGSTHIQTSSALNHYLGTCRALGQFETIREVSERWLRDLLATPIPSDAYQQSRRCIRLEHLAIYLATLPASVPVDSDLATRAAQEAVTILGSPKAWSALALVLHRAGQFELALEAIQASADHPDFIGGFGFYWCALAQLQLHAGDVEAARASYERSFLDKSEPWLAELQVLQNEIATRLLEVDSPASTRRPPALSPNSQDLRSLVSATHMKISLFLIGQDGSPSEALRNDRAISQETNHTAFSNTGGHNSGSRFIIDQDCGTIGPRLTGGPC